jgi:hypothetical protein
METLSSEVVVRAGDGFGDVKFMAAIGAFLGWQAVIFTDRQFLVGSSSASAVAARRRARSSRLPYSPYIALAAAIWVSAANTFWLSVFNEKICLTSTNQSRNGDDRCWPLASRRLPCSTSWKAIYRDVEQKFIWA